MKQINALDIFKKLCEKHFITWHKWHDYWEIRTELIGRGYSYYEFRITENTFEKAIIKFDKELKVRLNEIKIKE